MMEFRFPSRQGNEIEIRNLAGSFQRLILKSLKLAPALVLERKRPLWLRLSSV